MQKLFAFLSLILLFNSAAFGNYAAGILPYTYKDGQCLVLLGLEPRTKWKLFTRYYWSDFGGNAQKSDCNNIKYTAAREFSEETGAAYGNGEIDISIAYTLALMDNCYTLSDGKYTMHLVPMPYKDPEFFLNNVDEQNREKVNYAWLPLIDVFEYVHSARSLFTSTIASKEKHVQIALYPKMSNLLESPTGISVMKEMLTKTNEIDTLNNEHLGHDKKFLSGFRRAIETVLSFRPLVKLASLFK